MEKTKKLPKNKFYAIDYKTSLIVELTEKELEETYTIERMVTNYYCTQVNKMFVQTLPDTRAVVRYYKLYKENGEVARELKVGDVVRDKEDFIYKVLINKDEEFYCKMIGDCVLFSDPCLISLYNDIDFIDEGDDEDYDCEIDK